MTIAKPFHSGTGSRTGTVEAGAILNIDLDAIRENYRRLRRLLGPARCAAVVKANAYGLGAAEVATALLAEGCDTFFVAHVAEGLALRRALDSGPQIMVLNGLFPGDEGAVATAGLVPVLNSLVQLAGWREHARYRGQRLPAALQVDSGMSRLGMAPDEVAAIAADASMLSGVEVRLVISHLACADDPSNPVNTMQLQNFERLRAMLPPAPASLANSSGIFLGTGWHHDLARPGVALYGVNPTPGKPNPMVPVVRLQARVIQTRGVESGSGVGYGHAFRTQAPSRLATIALGYADGWPRRAAMAAFFDGVRLPFAGRVSMDSIVLDISALPEGAPKPGDLVELIGDMQPVDEVAAVAGTIGYEILTGLGDRFLRRYRGVVQAGSMA